MFTIKNRQVSKFKFFLGGILFLSLFLFVFSFSRKQETPHISTIPSSSAKTPASIEASEITATFGLRLNDSKMNPQEEIYRRPFSKPSLIKSNTATSRSPAIKYHGAYNQKPSHPSDFNLPTEKDIQNICQTLHKNIFENKNISLKEAYEELKCSSLIEVEEPIKMAEVHNQNFGGSQRNALTQENSKKTKKVGIIDPDKNHSPAQDAVENKKDDTTAKEPLDPKNLSILISSCQEATSSSDKNLYVWLLKSPDKQETYLILYARESTFLVYTFNDPIAFADNTETFLQVATIPIPTPQTEDQTKQCLVQTLNLEIKEKAQEETALSLL